MQKVLKNHKIRKRKQKKIAATLHLHQSAKIGLAYVHREKKKSKFRAPASRAKNSLVKKLLNFEIFHF